MQASRLWGHAWNQETKKQKKEREKTKDLTVPKQESCENEVCDPDILDLT